MFHEPAFWRGLEKIGEGFQIALFGTPAIVGFVLFSAGPFFDQDDTGRVVLIVMDGDAPRCPLCCGFGAAER